MDARTSLPEFSEAQADAGSALEQMLDDLRDAGHPRHAEGAGQAGARQRLED